MATVAATDSTLGRRREGVSGHLAASVKPRLHAARVVAGREALALLRSPAAYVALSVALLGAGWLLDGNLERARASGFLVDDRPFQPPLLAAILATSVFLAITAVVSVARERERGTLEVLFYGPIDEPAYVLGKFLGQVVAYLAALPVLAASLLLLSLLTGFAFSQAAILGLVVSVVPVAETVAFGLLFSALAGRLRTAILLFVATIALFLGIAVAYSVVVLVPVESPSSPILPLRNTLAALNTLVAWLSPFASLERALDAAALGAWLTMAQTLAAAVTYTAAALGAATLGLRRRGVRQRGGD